jgi:hypothetical protein
MVPVTALLVPLCACKVQALTMVNNNRIARLFALRIRLGALREGKKNFQGTIFRRA